MSDAGLTIDPLADALLAARLCAIEPGLGGMVLRGGVVADRIVGELTATLGEGAPIKRLPAHIDDERLYGGLDLGATLSSGRPVGRTGLLAEADGGAVIVPMAERLGEGVAAAIAGALDTAEVVAEREGLRVAAPARFVVIALDEGVEDERPPVALSERLAFWIDLRDVRGTTRQTASPAATPANAALPEASDEALEALVSIAAVLGIDSIRAPILALRAARASAHRR
ncbi:MAG: hypothetical protein K2P79_07765 [Sphingomonas sp.]|nr:hypothetical protein [Sphingomonas sp.]